MDVDGLSVGQSEVDDGANALDIETTRGKVGSEEEMRLTVAELLEGFETLGRSKAGGKKGGRGEVLGKREEDPGGEDGR